jgi:hypothetical protein
LERKRAEVLRVLALEQRLNRMRQAKESYAGMAGRQAEPTAGILREVFAGLRVDEPRETRRDLGDGWVARHEEISLGDVPLAKAMEYMRRVEKLKPPWIVTKCSIRTTGETPGVANVVLDIEAVEKRP